MDVIEAVQRRQSIREFAAPDIDAADLRTLIHAAIAAPSAGNRQAWHLYVVSDKTRLQQLAADSASQPFIATAPVAFVFCAEPELNRDRYGDRGRDLYSLQDVAAAVENVLLVVVELGLGACWCGGFDEERAAQILDLPEAPSTGRHRSDWQAIV